MNTTLPATSMAHCFKTIEKREDIPDLMKAQEFIGGYVEVLRLPNGDVLLFDEEGTMKNLPVNDEASYLLQSLYEQPTTLLVGNVIHLPKSLKQRKW